MQSFDKEAEEEAELFDWVNDNKETVRKLMLHHKALDRQREMQATAQLVTQMIAPLFVPPAGSAASPITVPGPTHSNDATTITTSPPPLNPHVEGIHKYFEGSAIRAENCEAAVQLTNKFLDRHKLLPPPPSGIVNTTNLNVDLTKFGCSILPANVPHAMAIQACADLGGTMVLQEQHKETQRQ